LRLFLDLPGDQLPLNIQA